MGGQLAGVQAEPGREPRRLDRWAGTLAGRQHGLVTRAQLLDLGFSRRMIESRLQRGMLRPVHRGVYAVGHSPTSREGRWLAAVLACGTGAVLSHRSAAALWGIRQTGARLIDVSAPGRRGRSRRGIAVHSADFLTDADSVTVEGVPVTTVARTIFDLATLISRDALEYTIHRAESQRLLRPDVLHALLARLPAHNGTAVIRSIIDAPGHELDARTRSRAERRFLRICRDHGVKQPEVDRWIPLPIAAGGLTVDFCWSDERLVVEVDEPRTHTTTRAFVNDRARDRALTAAGWRHLRYAEQELDRRPAAVARELLINLSL